jgi:hypothetical protein
MCGGYASEGKAMCPFDQIRHGEFVKGKWVVDATAATNMPPDESAVDTDGQIGFKMEENE